MLGFSGWFQTDPGESTSKEITGFSESVLGVEKQVTVDLMLCALFRPLATSSRSMSPPEANRAFVPSGSFLRFSN